MINSFDDLFAPEQAIEDDLTRFHDINLVVMREDQNHKLIPGNKARKLKYNLGYVHQQNCSAMLSFGGAYSNHILALSVAGKIESIKTIGIIRGDELNDQALNPVLQQAQDNGMELVFVSREEYKRRNDEDYHQQLKQYWGNVHIIPEGGSNSLGIQGASELVTGLSRHYDYIICACGTAGTLAGIIHGLYSSGARLTCSLGIAVLSASDAYWSDVINKFIGADMAAKAAWKINIDYHHGGYAKSSPQLVDFINRFEFEHNIPLDPIYTGKLFYAVYKMMEAHYFPKGSSLLLVHTGGLQTLQLCSVSG